MNKFNKTRHKLMMKNKHQGMKNIKNLIGKLKDEKKWIEKKTKQNKIGLTFKTTKIAITYQEW